VQDTFPLAANRLAFYLLLAFLLSAAAARGLAASRARRLMDMPGGRKQHPEPVPVIGGIAMFFGFAAGRWIGLVVDPSCAHRRARPPVLGGVADDMHDITPRGKFFIQLIAALFMTPGRACM